MHDPADIEGWGEHVDRVYLGWEFCPGLFPAPDLLREMAGAALANDLDVTVATSFLPPAAYERISLAIESLLRWWQSRTTRILEVVVNDVGLLNRLVEVGGSDLVLGRLLNKQPRDPRIAALRDDLPPELRAHLAASSCSFSPFVERITRLGVRRVEYDNLLQGVGPGTPDLAQSLHFPYGYLTTGRNCAWGRTGRGEAWYFDAPCGRRCVGESSELRTGHAEFRIESFGNTLFFVNEDVATAVRTLAPDRLVYTPALP